MAMLNNQMVTMVPFFRQTQVWAEQWGFNQQNMRHAYFVGVYWGIGVYKRPYDIWLVVWNMNFMTFHSVGNQDP